MWTNHIVLSIQQQNRTNNSLTCNQINQIKRGKIAKNHLHLESVYIPKQIRKHQHCRSTHKAHLPDRTCLAWTRHPTLSNNNWRFSLFCSRIDFNQCNAPTPMTPSSTRSRCRHKAPSTATANPHNLTQHKKAATRRCNFIFIALLPSNVYALYIG